MDQQHPTLKSDWKWQAKKIMPLLALEWRNPSNKTRPRKRNLTSLSKHASHPPCQGEGLEIPKVSSNPWVTDCLGLPPLDGRLDLLQLGTSSKILLHLIAVSGLFSPVSTWVFAFCIASYATREGPCLQDSLSAVEIPQATTHLGDEKPFRSVRSCFQQQVIHLLGGNMNLGISFCL